MISLNTERLLIRDHIAEDIKDLHRLLSHPIAMKYLPEIATQTLEESRSNLEAALNEVSSSVRNRFFLAILEKRSSQYIGEIGFTVEKRTVGGLVANLGYFILPDWWGQGITTEAAKEVIGFAFEECNVHKMTTGCLSENTASERVMKKCGFIKEAYLKEHSWHEGQWKDRVEYGLLREQWLSIRS